ncbi:MAG: AAA domain-containing protein, partial [Verrucomicrobiota bacterium]|nr:AAA domain-containing protein [Verrucomicrobiota bacterium]
KRQAEHIEYLLDQSIEADVTLRDYVDAWQYTPEYFFVKNLESVQGDERDVILLSTVFGPTADGKVAQNFGPINQPQGEKRMNVLVTRAKERLSVFTSLKPSDITNQSLGAQVWKRYLDFAKTGQLQTHDSAEANAHIPASIDKWFYDRLTQDGYGVIPQVGVSKWRVDLGIQHDANPGHYICGIQFDGSQYYNTSYAHERDHLRDKVLIDSGWIIIRVWCVDFFTEREATYNKVKMEIEAALAAKCAVNE